LTGAHNGQLAPNPHHSPHILISVQYLVSPPYSQSSPTRKIDSISKPKILEVQIFSQHLAHRPSRSPIGRLVARTFSFSLGTAEITSAMRSQLVVHPRITVHTDLKTIEPKLPLHSVFSNKQSLSARLSWPTKPMLRLQTQKVAITIDRSYLS
jgi:hypothetical protein